MHLAEVLAKYGTKSTVRQQRFEFYKKEYQAIYLNLLRTEYETQKLDLLHLYDRYQDDPGQKMWNYWS